MLTKDLPQSGEIGLNNAPLGKKEKWAFREGLF